MDQRFEVPLYTVAEAARHLDIAPSTIRYWIDEKRIIRSIQAAKRGEPTLPFAALAEIEFVQSMRRADLSLRAVTEGVLALQEALGPDFLRRSV